MSQSQLFVDWDDVRRFQVWYQSYADTTNPVFSYVSDLLEQAEGVTPNQFTAHFALKVTWQDMRPAYETTEEEVQ